MSEEIRTNRVRFTVENHMEETPLQSYDSRSPCTKRVYEISVKSKTWPQGK